MQTGGPDGDLGSNEIKISKDKTIGEYILIFSSKKTYFVVVGIVDGSGVLYDPAGLNREELLRLATKRLMVSHFDVSLLSPNGFRVLVDETFVRLPGNTSHQLLLFRF